MVRVLGRQPLRPADGKQPRGLQAPRWDAARERHAPDGAGPRRPRGTPPPAHDLRGRPARPGRRLRHPGGGLLRRRGPGPARRRPRRPPRPLPRRRRRGRRRRHALRLPRAGAPGPGPPVTLRYAYGAAQPSVVRRLVARWRRAADPLGSSRRAGRAGCRRSASARRPWLTRELAWDAYLLRSGATYEECRGAPRHLPGRRLPVRHRRRARLPRRARAPAPDGLRRPAAGARRPALLGPAGPAPGRRGADPVRHGRAVHGRCDLGSSTDMDLWLLLAASEYGLAHARPRTFSAPVRWPTAARRRCGPTCAPPTAIRSRSAGRTAATSRARPATGRTSRPSSWAMTESLLITAQLAYVYPRLAELADAARRPRLRGAAARQRRPRPGGDPRGLDGPLVPARVRRRPATRASARSSASRSRGRCWRAPRRARRRRGSSRASGAS